MLPVSIWTLKVSKGNFQKYNLISSGPFNEKGKSFENDYSRCEVLLLFYLTV